MNSSKNCLAKFSDLVFKQRWMVALIPLFCLLVFFPILGNDFVRYDDYVYIVENPLVTEPFSFAKLGVLFSSEHEQNYAPLLWLSFSITYDLFGASPMAFHGLSLFAHAACACLLGVLAIQLGLTTRQSILLSLIWGLHPQRIEAVAWASALKEPLAGFFALLTVSFWLKLRADPNQNKWSIFAFVSFALALGFKQTPLALPWILVAWHLLSRTTAATPVVLRSLPLFVLSIVAFFAALMANQDAVSQAVYLNFESGWNHVPHSLAAFSFMLSKMFLPIHLVPDYPVPTNTLAWAMAGMIAIAGLIAFVFSSFQKRNSLFLLAALWFGGHWLLVSGLFPTPLEFTADRLTYLPSAIAIVALGGHLFRKFEPSVFWRVIFLGLLGGASFLQLRNWKNSERFFQHNLAYQQRHYPSLLNAAILAARDQNSAEGIERLQRAIAYYPKRPAAYHLLYQIYSIHGAEMEAKEVLHQWNSEIPDDPLLHRIFVDQMR